LRSRVEEHLAAVGADGLCNARLSFADDLNDLADLLNLGRSLIHVKYH
jgi:hypothetical protein